MSFEETWETASINESNDDWTPPEGVYVATLTRSEAFTSKDGKELIILNFRSDLGEWAALFGFGSDKATAFTKTQCARLGVKVNKVHSLYELDSALGEVVGNQYTVEVVKNGKYTNTYVQGEKSGESEGGLAVDATVNGAAPSSTFTSSDDIPF